MIVAYSTYEIDAPYLNIYEDQLLAAAHEYRKEKGNIFYEILVDPRDQRKRAQVEAWQTREDVDAHRGSPLHDQIVRATHDAQISNIRDWIFECNRQMDRSEFSSFGSLLQNLELGDADE